MVKNLHFDLYRYQIIPKDRYFQGQLFDGISSIEELIEKKNDIFHEKVIHIEEWKAQKTIIKNVLEFDNNNIMIYRIAPKRLTRRETEDFQEELLEDWPSIQVIVWNDPTKQIIAIQDRQKAFQNTKSVLKVILQVINIALENHQLKVYAEPITRKEAFWDIISEYQGRIKDIRFELITPNMANISGALSDDLKDLAKNTNTAKTTLEINSDDDSVLTINRQNAQINGLVNYASEGGGNITLRARGINKSIKTSDTIKSLEINELEISGDTIGIVISMLDKILNEE